MIPKKSAGQQRPRSRVTLASRLLSNAVPGTMPVPRVEEPWRNKKPTGNSRGDALIGHVKAIIDGSRAHSLTAAGFVQRANATGSPDRVEHCCGLKSAVRLTVQARCAPFNGFSHFTRRNLQT